MMSGTLGRNATTESRRKAILHAALTSFSTKGFTETTMEDIHQLSGASIGSIYHHFANKEMLALALYIEGRNDLNTNLLAAITARPHPSEGIKALVRTYLDWFERQPDLGLYLMQAGNNEYIRPQVESLRQTRVPFSTHLLDWLAPFIDDGTVVRFPPQLYVPLVIGPSREFMRRWLEARHPQDFSEAREPLAEAAWVALSTSHTK